MSEHTAYVVVDLGYGDAGKGSLVDALTARTGARLNVRFNGGGQAAHNVVLPDGRHHTFSQFGSGMFDPDVKTYLSRHFLWNPIAMQAEAEILDAEIAKDETPAKGRASQLAGRAGDNVRSRTFVDKAALVVTPWHQAMNRLREFARDDRRHGSCGVGIGEAMMEARDRPILSLRAGYLMDWNTEKLRWHLEEVAACNLAIWAELFREHCLGSNLPDFLHKDRDFLFTKEAPLNCAALFKRIACDTPMVDGAAEQKKLFDDTEDVVFEGAQGILIDEKFGFNPYTTWSTCTSRNARQILKEIGWVGQTKIIGALRAYAVRHGNGPFVTEVIDRHGNDPMHMAFKDDHNSHNEWQGSLRVGWFDAIATHYAMRAEWQSSFDYAGYSSPPGIHSLAITNFDRMESWLRAGHRWNLCTGYKWNGDGPLVFEPGNIFHPHPGSLTDDLFQARPSYDCSGDTVEDLLVAIEHLLSCPIEIASQGPTRNGKSWSGSLSEPRRK